MATIAQVEGGFEIKTARRIIANLTVLTKMPAESTCAYKVEFPTGAAKAPRAVLSTVTRILPGGTTESYPLVLSVEANDPVITTAAFSGRTFEYTVKDDAASGNRVVTVTIYSANGTGLNEQWRHQFTVVPSATALAATSHTDFSLKNPKGVTFDMVNVTP